MSDNGGPGSRLRTAVFAATIFFFTTVNFAVELPITALSYYPRFLFAVLLLVITLHQGQKWKRPLAQAPPMARALMRWTWVLVLIAGLSTFWSIAPVETALQAGVFAVLAANMQAHITGRWHRPGTIAHDMRVIYWVLALSVVGSLAMGTQSAGRLSGLYENPNGLGILAAMAVAIGIGLLRDRRSWTVAVVTLLCAVTMVLAESRTALVALVAALLWFALRRRTLSPSVAILGSFAAAGVVLIIMLGIRVPMPSVITRFLDGSDLLNTRDVGWQFAIDLWERRPTLGYGFRVGEQVFIQNLRFTSFTADGAHNSYLQTLLELGVVGIIPLLLIVVVLLRALWRAPMDGFSVGLALLVIVGLAMSLAESALLGVGTVISWAFWLGAAALCSTTPNRPRKGKLAKPKRPVARRL